MSSAREDQTAVKIRCAEWVGKPNHDHIQATVSQLCPEMRRKAADSGENAAEVGGDPA